MRQKVGEKEIQIAGTDPSDLARLGGIIRRGFLAPAGPPPAWAVFAGEAVTPGSFSGLLATADLMLLEMLGLLEFDGRSLRCPFYAHLVEGKLIFTDPDVPDEDQASTYLDPLWEARDLARVIVREPAGDALDMGCGCGILSLLMASYAGDVVGIDVNPRALAVSRFNAAINGVRNVTFLEGDLFSAVRDRRFDRIVFNSPTDQEGDESLSLLFAGESILARFFAEVTSRLAGLGYCQVNLGMNDDPTSRFNDRLLSWLGGDASSCQILTLIILETLKGSGGRWRREWLTLRRGPGFLAERPFRYDLVPEGAGSQLIVRLLDQHEQASGGAGGDGR
jgi:SAM-dependent methyltransferase